MFSEMSGPKPSETSIFKILLMGIVLKQKPVVGAVKNSMRFKGSTTEMPKNRSKYPINAFFCLEYLGVYKLLLFLVLTLTFQQKFHKIGLSL